MPKAALRPTPAPVIFASLAAPFPPERVSWRVGSTNAEKTRGLALAYISARDVMARLDDVCGPAGWSRRYVPMSNGTTCCELGLRIDGEWVWKSDGPGATDYEAEKGAYSDAFKRAAVNWGVGRYLYDLVSPWVAVEQRGRSYVIRKDESARLVALLKAICDAKTMSKAAVRRSGGYPRLERAIRAAKTLKALQVLWEREQGTIALWPEDWREHITAEKDIRKALLSPNGTRAMLENSAAVLNGAEPMAWGNDGRRHRLPPQALAAVRNGLKWKGGPHR